MILTFFSLFFTLVQSRSITTTKYLFAYFRGEYETNGEQVYFATSEDGLHWEELNGKGSSQKPVLTSTVGENGVRDMFIIRAPTNDHFYLIASDLKINGNWDWDRAQHNGSHAIIVWESDDLVHWTDPRNVTVSLPNAGCTWAPEATFVEDLNAYVVYWASRLFVNGTWSQQKIMSSITKDFYHFSDAQVFIEENYDVIDTTIFKSNLDNKYYRFSKNESKKNIVVQRSNYMFSKWETVSAPVVEAENGVEAPLMFKFNNENKWCLMLDNYGKKGYYPFITRKLTGNELVFEKLSSSQYSMPGNPRHGYIIPITDDEYRDVRNRWYIE